MEFVAAELDELADLVFVVEELEQYRLLHDLEEVDLDEVLLVVAVEEELAEETFQLVLLGVRGRNNARGEKPKPSEERTGLRLQLVLQH